MRLTSLTLTNYGVFRSTRIDFDPAPGRLNLLIAPNGAGKSILRGAFCDLLFGIHGQTPMGFRYGYPNMRLTAEAVTRDGAFVLGRRKGQGNTLIDGEGNALDGAMIARVLGRTDLALLERLFALDTERLRLGGQALLASGGELADALLSAAGGLRGAREIRVKLEAARDALAPKHKSQNRPFYQALDAWLDARKRLSTTTLKPELREKQEIELRQTRAQQETADRQARASSAGIARLQRMRGTAPLLDEHEAASVWLTSHPDAPILPADAAQRLDRAESDVLNSERMVEREEHAHAEAIGRADGLAVQDALLDRAADIDALIPHAGVARQATRDLPKRQAELDRKANRIATILRALGLILPVERAAEAAPPRPALQRARKLLAEHTRIRADLDRLPESLRDKRAKVAEAERDLALLPQPRAIEGLRRLIREIAADGEPAMRANEAARGLSESRAAVAAALSRVAGWTGDADALAALPAPAAERCEEMDAARARAVALSDQMTAELTELHREAEEQRRALAAVAADGTLPEITAVDEARSRRDQGWRLIYRQAFTQTPPEAAELRAWTGEVPLPLAYERAVLSADELADRRGREADALARAGQHRRRLDGLATEIAAKEAARAAAQEQRTAATAAWAECCAPLGLGSAGLGVVRAFLRAREDVLRTCAALPIEAERVAALAARHAGWATRLSTELGETATTEPLPALLLLAHERVEAAREAGEARTRLEAWIAAKCAERDADRHALDAAEARHATWRGAWAHARAALGRPEAEDPDLTTEMLDLMVELDTEQDAAADLRVRIREMQEEIRGCQQEAAALSAAVAPDLIDADTFEQAAKLRARLAEQRDAASRREEQRTQVGTAETKLRAARARLSASRDLRGTVLALIGSETVADARVRVALANERAHQEAVLGQCEDALRQQADGLDLRALRAEIASVPRDELMGAIEAARRDHEAALVDVQHLATRIGEMTADLDRQARETGAEAAAAEQEAALARMGRVLGEATLQHLAAAMLDIALGSVGDAGAPAVLGRIGALFRTVTGGAYDGIAAEAADDGSARLVARERDHPDEPKQIAQLSEGTRDQLFLALRIAAIEDHAKGAPSLPFVGDDILQTFDDDRALAAMRALVELSRTTQVILLSHHRHLLDVAVRLPDGCVRVCTPSPLAP